MGGARRFRVAFFAAAVLLVAASSTPTAGGTLWGRGNTPPVARISANPTSGAAPLTVSFDGSASSDAKGSVVSYLWTFGDGSPKQSGAKVSHTYTAAGTHTASLRVTDNGGATHTATVSIVTGVANVPPSAVAGASPNPVKVGATVSFSSAGSRDTDGTIATYKWDFGDGTATSNAPNPTHVYATPGSRTATLTVTDDDGAINTRSVTVTVNANQAPHATAGATPVSGKAPLAVSFSSAGSNDGDGTIVSYAWSFSDGGSSNAANPSHTFMTAGSMTATLTVTDDDGATDSDTVGVSVSQNQTPIAVANGSPSAGQAPLTVHFSSAGSDDLDGEIVGWSWDFGDSSSSSQPDPTYTYSALGSYTATLTVTDDNGATDTDTVIVTVTVAPNEPPVAAASGTPTSGKEDLTVSFSPAGSSDPEGGTLTYGWDFGDGGSSTQANPTHTYMNPGDFLATLTVTDPANGQASATVAIHVTANVAPTAVAGASPLTGKQNLLVTFSSSGSSDDGTIASRQWDFGDGTTSTQADPAHLYTSAGTKTVTLTVTDDNGAIDTDTVTITVTPNNPPVAVANATPRSGPRPLVVNFNGSSSADPDGLPLTYSWNFGDGSAMSTAANPSHTYAEGTWVATLTVTDDAGATNGASVTITVVNDVAALDAPTSPVVMTGAGLPSLVGTAPGNIVAFKFNLVSGAPVWSQVPVQVDQRKVIPFGTYPSSSTFTGTEGTVYGKGTTGGASLPLQANQTALQYADANTWVGADSNANFDADDELVFMAFDAGGQVQGANPGVPSGVVPGTGVGVKVQEGGGGLGWVYLYVRSGSLDPAAGKNYVTYNFSLNSGSYKTTYKRWWVAGPPGNPETSSVVTPNYQIKFTDRWKETEWNVKASGASGVDFLDAAKLKINPNDCIRSNQTAAEGEGAFVANIDGPVRAIRSYVGTNSGPNTQRTHLMYRDRVDVITDLRVHSIPSFLDYIDYNSAASGMTYRSSTVPGGVTINGVNDAVPSTNALPTWEAVNGPQGTVFNVWKLSASVPLGGTIDSFYRDQTSPTEPQCWGDTPAAYYGASGMFINSGVPDTDPAYTNPPAVVQWTRSTTYGSPVADPSTIPASAAAFRQDTNPLLTTVTAYTG